MGIITGKVTATSITENITAQKTYIEQARYDKLLTHLYAIFHCYIYVMQNKALISVLELLSVRKAISKYDMDFGMHF